MRYFMVSLAITAVIGLSWYQRWRTRLLLLAVAGLAAMVSNWIRIYTLILIGDATDMKHYVIAVSHDGYGWLVYVVFLLPVLWFARVLDKREAMLPQAGAAARPRSTAS
jgi:exosortase/archaeosortase family protein